MFKYLAWSENIKKRVCRYLLQRYLGQFLEEKLTLDQLSVDLYNGTGNIYDVSLDCEALDELGESQGWPFEFVDGYIRQISVVIPWSTLLRDESCVEVHGLSVTIQPKMRFESATSMLESMWSSMSSSMQMAAECLQQEPGVANAKPVEGIEHFAATIDSILSRVKIRFINTKIRMEHMPKDSSSGVALEVHVKNIEYCDEAGTEPTDLIENEKNKTFVVTTFSNKRINFEGISLHTDEFPSTARTMARSLINDSSAAKTKMKENECDETENENKISSSSSSSSPKEYTPEEESYMSATDSVNLKEEQQTFSKVSPPQETIANTTPILFAKITGRSELYIKLKQSEDATGPKVELQLTLGSLITFLSPRQLHTIIELCDGLASPHLEDTSNVPVRNSSMPCKPMKATDFERVEAQLLGGLVGGSMPSLLAKHGWSGASDNMDDSEIESERFLPLTSPHGVMTDSCASSMSSMSTSAVSSASYSSKHRVKRNKKIPQIDGDPTAEVSHINIRVASFACILLHNDILIPMLMGDECLMGSSVQQMQETAESFFEKLGAFAICGYGNKDFEYAEKVFEKATTLSHLRLISASVTLEGNEKTSSQGCLVSGHLTVARAQLQESLYSNTNTHPSVDTFTLLHFQRKGKDEEYEINPLDALPDIKIHFTQTQKAMRIAGEKRLVYPTAEFNINLQPCTVDLDITLMDRIWAVLHPVPLCGLRPGFNMGQTNGQLLDQTIAAQFETHTTFKVSCSKLLLTLRFPVIDLRPQHDISRTPWWQRNVRPDYLLATLHELTVTNLPQARRGTEIKIQAHQIDLDYFENEKCSGFNLGRAYTDNLVDTSNLMFGIEAKYPTVNLTFLGSKFGRGTLEQSSDEEAGCAGASMAHSAIFMDGLGAGNAKPSPFSHKKTMHQSDTPHDKDTRDNVEELIVPGSPDEMAEFEQHSISRAAIQIECQVPVLSVQLDSKHLYEVIYNRINSDLLLWEPTPQNPYPGSRAHPTQHIDPNIYPVFSMCKNGLNYDSDTASSSSDESNVYYSTYDQKCRDYGKARSVSGAGGAGSEGGDRRHNLCLSLKVGKGLLTLYTLVRDGQKNVVPGQRGEAVLDVSGLSLCHVSGVRSDSRTALLALYAHTAKLYHAGLIPFTSVRAPLRLYGCGLPSHLVDTIYPSGKGVRLDANGVKEMLTIALSVKPNPDLPNYKNIKVSVGIRGATLWHRTEVSGRSWLMQLMDQLDVLDYPVPGYRPSTVLTQLHVHLWDCAIDYRPLHLPLRAMVTLGSFSISSNVIAEANTSNLRFIAEECGLFLADMTSREKSSPAPHTNTAVDLQKDYVCVVDLGLFELSLRLTEKSASVLSPRVDLRASNDAVHVRTCADSARALCRLLAYVAADGDATNLNVPPQRDHTPTPAPTQHLLGDGMEDKVTEEIRDLSPSEAQQVNDLMAEAMKESPSSSYSDANKAGANEGVEVFFFPDEPHPKSPVVSQDDRNSSAPSDPAANQHLLADEELQQEFVGEVKSAEPEAVQLLPAIIHVERDLGNVHADIVDRKNYKNIEKKQDTSSDGANTDDEFCMLGDEFTSRVKVNEYAEPVVRWLTNEPMSVLENHFALPVGKGDVLKAPKNFPVPVMRYTLCEMTLVWHMYGGNDFKTNTDTQAKKSVTINDQAVHSPTLTRRSSESDPYNVIPRSPNCRYSAQSYLLSGVSYKKGHEGVRLGEAGARAPPTPPAPWKNRGGAGRLQTILVEMELNKMRFRHESYPSGGRYASRQTLAVGVLQVRDRHKDSQFNMFLNLYTPDDKPRGRNTNMVVIKAVHLRPDPRLPAQECCLKVSLQPLRFIIDQDTLLFLSDFFSKLGEDTPTSERTLSTCSEHSQGSGSGGSVSSASRHSTPTHQLPVMSVGAALKDGERRKRQASVSSDSSAMVNSDTYSEDMASLNGGGSSNYDPLLEQYEAEQLLSDNLIQLEEGCRRAASTDADSDVQDDITETSSVAASDVADDAPIYFRRVIFSPEVPIRLDYYGKRVNLSQGSLAGIVVGLVLGLGQLNCSELKLKRLSHRHGLLGFNRLLHWLLQEWLHDIKRNQLAGILGSVGPMRSLLQLFQGVYDLFRLPWEQWRRDGRVVRGLRRGAASFSARTAIAALDITTRLVHLIQATAETAFDMLTPSPSLGLPGSYPRHRRARRRQREPPRPPQDIREGVANAYQHFKEGFSDTAATMVCVAAAERDARGYSGAVGGVLRQLPGAAVAPVALAAAAAADILGGVRAQLVPGARDHARDKWRYRHEPGERDVDSDVEEAEE